MDWKHTSHLLIRQQMLVGSLFCTSPYLLTTRHFYYRIKMCGHKRRIAIFGMMTGFGMEDVLRKYIRYALNEKQFNPEVIANLIQLRKASMLEESQVAEIINDISRRIVREKGPVVMDMSGYSEKGFKRKLAVQALFGKVFYLSELPEFCSQDNSLIVKEIFGVADEDADKLRSHTLSEAGDLDSLEKMVDDSDSEDSDGSPAASPQPT